MTHTFILCSASHSLRTKYGLGAQFPLPSDQGRKVICNLKYNRVHKDSTRSTDASEKNNNMNNKMIIRSKKYHEVQVRSYEQQSASGSNIPRHGGFIETLITIFKFSRPFTMAATAITVLSVATLPLTSFSQVTPVFLVGVLQALAINLLVRLYISGINEIYDIEIDKINKPYLPLASGALSMELAIVLVTMSLVGSVTWGIMSRSPPLLFGVIVGCLFGTLYSLKLPFMRWKRYPVLVGVVVIMIGAVATPFSTFFHIQKYVLGSPTMFFTKSLIFTCCFLTMATIFLGFLKDIPDIIGDQKHGLQTLAVRLGAERVFWICISAFIMTYGCAIGVGLTSSSLITKLVTVPGHLSMACILLYRALSVDLSVDGAPLRFFMFLWNMSCAELLLIPFVR